MATADRRDTRAPELSEFETRRAELVGQIGDSLEQVLAQINALNRSLEGIIEIGNEFASVEALWSQFETVMGRGNEDGVKEGSVSGSGEGLGERVADGQRQGAVGGRT